MAALWVSTLPTFPVVRNTGEASVIATTRMARISTGPMRITRRATRSTPSGTPDAVGPTPSSAPAGGA